MPDQRYTIGESCALLDIDRVTLMRWLTAEGIQPATDVRDKRYKYLSRRQLLDLARLHERTIRDDTSVGPRLTGLQRELVARIQALEEGQAANRHLLDEVLARIDAMDRRTAARYNRLDTALQPPYTPPAPRQPLVIADDGHAAGEDGEPSESPHSAAGDAFAAFAGYVRLQPGEYRTLPPIPLGWVTPREMARELGVALRTFAHHLEPRPDRPHDNERYGTIPYHRRRWQGRQPGTMATELLDPDQQEMARQMFRFGQR